MATEKKFLNDGVRDTQPAFDSVAITTNVTTQAECVAVYVGVTDDYDLYVNGAWVLHKNMIAGMVYPFYATGARHNSGSSAPDAGDINFLY